MGKRIISQRRGRGSPAFRAPRKRVKTKPSYRPYDDIERTGVIKGEVIGFIDDPGHNAILMKILFENNESVVMLAPEGIKVGDTVYSGANAPIGLGNMVPLIKVPEGYFIFDLENHPGRDGKFVRSPGSYAIVVSKEGSKVIVRMPSNRKIKFNGNCRVMIGVISGGGRLECPLMKAGTAHHKHKSVNNRWPIVKGVSMNAVSHPFGWQKPYAQTVHCQQERTARQKSWAHCCQKDRKEEKVS